MNKKKSSIALILICLSVSGCLRSNPSRTSIDKWTTRTFEDIGITLEYPEDAIGVETLGVEKWKTGTLEDCELLFKLHEYRFPMDDSFFFIQFKFMRLTASQYREFRNGNHFWSNNGIWYEHHSETYPTATHFVWTDFNHGELLGWRQDYFSADGDVVVAGVIYGPYIEWSNEMIIADSNAVERVLGSVKVTDVQM